MYAYLVVVEIILFMGFFLLLFGANPSASFTDWVYRSLDRAMEPFRGIFTPIELGTTAGNDVQSVFETSVLFAMIVYGIVAIAEHALITWLSNRMYRLEAEEDQLLYQASLDEETARLRADVTAADARGPTTIRRESAADDRTASELAGLIGLDTIVDLQVVRVGERVDRLGSLELFGRSDLRRATAKAMPRPRSFST